MKQEEGVPNEYEWNTTTTTINMLRTKWNPLQCFTNQENNKCAAN